MYIDLVLQLINMEQQYFVQQAMEKTTCMIQNINGKLMIVSYALADKFVEHRTPTTEEVEHRNLPLQVSPPTPSIVGLDEVMKKLMLVYPCSDLVVTYHHDKHSNTIFNLKAIDDALDGLDNVVQRDGFCSYLEFRTINDLGFLKILHGVVNRGTIEIKNEQFSYALMRVTEIHEEWLDMEFMDLIKRKLIDSSLIVFEKPSSEIEYDKQSGNIILMKDYVIMFNELHENERPISKLQYKLCNNEYFLCMTSEKEFVAVFRK